MEYKTDAVLDIQGNAIFNASVRVLDENKNLAKIYDSSGAEIGNPVGTNQTGEFSASVANGKYYFEVSVNGRVYETRGPITFFDPGDTDASSKIGFQQSGAGTVPRTVAAKLGDKVSVFDFMTVEQVNNCWLRLATVNVTTAIQAALNEVAVSGCALHFPAGVYSVSGNLVGPRNVVLTGDGWRSEIKLADGANSESIIKFGDASNVTTVELHDIAFNGNKTNNPTAGDGVVIVRGYKANMRNVRVSFCKGDGVQYEAVGSCFENYIHGLSSYSNDGYGLRMTGSVTDTHIFDADIGFNAEGGVVLATSCSVNDSTIWGGGQQNSNGIVTAGVSWQIINNKIEGHGQHGVLVAAGNHNGFIHGNKIYANSFTSTTTGQYDGIYIEAGVNYGTVTGNKVYSSVSADAPYSMRYALNFAGAHAQWTISANDFGLLTAPGAQSTGVIVNGLLNTDKSDNNWVRTDIVAQRSVNFNPVAGAWTAFPFDLKPADPLSEFANGVFTPKNSGRYRIEVGITCTPGAAGESLGAALYTSAGVAIRRVSFFPAQGTGLTMVSGCLEEFLTAGVAYDIRYFAGSAATQFLAGASFTFIRIRSAAS